MKIKNIIEQVLFRGRKTLKSVRFDMLNRKSIWSNQVYEVYDTGDAAVILPYHKKNRTVLLIRQLRIATYVNGNEDGMLIEACAGKLNKGENPDECIVRELEEETGYVVLDVQKISEAYIAPGAITEKIHFYITPYNETMKKYDGGGLEEEGEDIEVMEVSFETAYRMMEANEIKDVKTIVLLQYLKMNEAVLCGKS
ncbi:MAG: NUDIX domain-containing protein [Chitinophagaceae bacterium]|jgi:nudix-type nucleoside diphosphatase (YffH/AdpP family)